MPFLRLGLCLLICWVATAAGAQTYRTDASEQIVSAGSIGGSWFIITTAMFDMFGREIEGLRYSIVPGGGVANPMAVHGGLATVGLGLSALLSAAEQGRHPFTGEMPELRAFANLNTVGVLHPFFLTRTGITSLHDLAKQQYPLRVDTGPRGTGGELAAARLLESYGASYDQIRAWGGRVTHSSYREAADRMKDGHIEAFINDDIIGNPVFVDLAAARDVRILPIDRDIADLMVGEYSYSHAVIPAGSYEGQSEATPTTAQHFVFFGNTDIPDDLAYAMTRLLFARKSDLVTMHPVFGNLDPALGAHHLGIPLHPGAKTYYIEAGLLE